MINTITYLLKTKKALIIQTYPNQQLLTLMTDRIHEVANLGESILIINTDSETNSVFSAGISEYLNIIHRHTIATLLKTLKSHQDDWLKNLGLIIIESGSEIFYDVNKWELAFYLLQDKFLKLQRKDFPNLCVLVEPHRAIEPAIKEALPLFDTLALAYNETTAWAETSVHIPKESIKTQWWTIWSSKESQDYLNKIRPNNTGRNVGIIAPLAQFAGQRTIDKKNNLALMDMHSGEIDRLENYAENELSILYHLEPDISWQTLKQFKDFTGCLTVYCHFGNPWATLHKLSYCFQDNILCNVITNNVLLLDYFLDNAHCFAEVPLEPLAPRIKRNSAHNTIFILLQRLKNLKQIPLYTIRSAINAIDDIDEYTSHLDSYAKFIELTKKYFGEATANQLSLTSAYEWHAKHHKYEVVYYVCFLNEHLNITIDWLEPVKILDGNTVFEEISKEHLYQNFWVGKLVLYFGKVFQVVKINPDKNIVNISHCSNKLLMDYRVQKEILIDNPINDVNKINSLSTHIVYGDNHLKIDTFTLSYCITSKHVVANDSQWARDAFIFKDVSFSKRAYQFGRAIRISLFDNDGKSLFTDNTALAFSAWLNEASITLFPKSYQYFVCAPQILNDHNRPQNTITDYCIPKLCYLDTLGDYPCVWVFEDSQTDMGLVHSIYDNYAYLIDLCYDWLKWYLIDLPTPKHSQVCLQNEHYKISNWFGFGHAEMDKAIDLMGLKTLLEQVFDNRGIFNLTARRKNVTTELPINKYLDDNYKTLHHIDCDICGVNISPEQPSVALSDGRISCQPCHEVAVTSIETLREIYEKIIERFFAEQLEITHFAQFDIALVDQKVISSKQDKIFIPTSSFDNRAIGLASMHTDSATYQNDNLNYTILIESGHNLESTASTLVHELCHIWQYQSLDYDKLQADYGKYLIEGQAIWTEELFLDYLDKHHFNYFDAERLQIQQQKLDTTKLKDDEYGKGYQLLKAKLNHEFGSSLSAYEWLKKHYGK